MLVTTLLGFLAPVLTEGMKQLLARFVGGVKPTTIDEVIKLDKAEVERIEALAKLDTPIGTPSQWVVDLRASARYIGALAVIAVGVATLFIPEVPKEVQLVALEAANISFGFLFGSRIVSNWKVK